MRIQVNARNRGHEFAAAAGESVLYAGLRAAVDLPYECATGTCGTCKAKLVAGTVRDLWPQAPGLRHVNAQRGELLMCQCAAENDATFEVASFVHAADGAAPGPASGLLRDTRMLTRDVASFALELGQPLDFDAGQFVVVRAPGLQGYRAYSMVNHAPGATRLEFVARRKPGGGFSAWLFGATARDGARLDLFGPLGKATFHPGLEKDILCIAGGSGIAGMMSILAHAARERQFERHFGWVFFGVRGVRDAFFLEELSALVARVPGRLAVTLALSEEAPPATFASDWPHIACAQGMVHEVARQAMAGRYGNVRAYVAGPPPAVDAAIRVLLLEARLTTDNIRYDKFS